MKMDKNILLKELVRDYKRKHKKSEALFQKAQSLQIRGCSHNLRYFAPFPFYDSSCRGARVQDVDGNTYIDFWQGHFANILGHNPQIVLDALVRYFQEGQGMTTGFPGLWQKKLAELILERIPSDKIRFTTSGTLATMYAIMLARAFTRRELVMKVGGGWHGAHPYVLKGITSYDKGFSRIESAGLSPETDSSIVITRFNDVEDLKKKFSSYGDRTACLILEPFIGSGGFIFGTKEYIKKTREIADQYKSLLIFDEVVSGFRFHAGGIQTLFGIKPDLTVLGKAIGGGMPVSAVLGREDVMELCDPDASPETRVKFEGGTFSAHPASMLAGFTFIKHLVENEDNIYPEMGRMGDKVRNEIEKIFSRYGFFVKCSGADIKITKHSSVVGVHFLHKYLDKISSPEEVWNPKISDFDVREKLFKLAMLEEGFNVFHGFGTISAAHTESDIQASLDAVERIAKKWNKYRLKLDSSS